MAALTGTQLAACGGYQDSINALQTAVNAQAAVIAALAEELETLRNTVSGTTTAARRNAALITASTANTAAATASSVVVGAGVIKHAALLEET